MTIDCPGCLITHASAVERDAMHAASERVRRWFRRQVTLSLEKPAKPKPSKRLDSPKVQPRTARRVA